MCESIDHGGADSESRERAGAGHKGDFGEVVESLVICCESVANETKETLGKVMAGVPFVFGVV